MSSGECDLERLLAEARPERRPGEFVFVSVDAQAAHGLTAHATVRESEGLTLVIPRGEADAQGLDYDFVAAWITLTVHSALDAVGLTAAVAARLADAGISCNVIAGLFHDHLLVPVERAGEAMTILGSGSADSARRPPAS
jgi:hypothetical protein